MVSDQPAPAPAVAPLHNALCAAIAATWCTGRADFADIATAVVDVVAEHVRRYGVPAMDPRIAHAMAEAIAEHTESDGGPLLDPLQQTIDYHTALAAGYEPTAAMALARREADIDPGETIIARIGADGRAVDFRRLHSPRFGGAR